MLNNVPESDVNAILQTYGGIENIKKQIAGLYRPERS